MVDDFKKAAAEVGAEIGSQVMRSIPPIDGGVTHMNEKLAMTLPADIALSAISGMNNVIGGENTGVMPDLARSLAIGAISGMADAVTGGEHAEGHGGTPTTPQGPKPAGKSPRK
jgi:hypothetical protein